MKMPGHIDVRAIEHRLVQSTATPLVVLTGVVDPGAALGVAGAEALTEPVKPAKGKAKS